MEPSLYDLKYFLEICQTKNLSRASERIGISQPSLSLAMQRLESSIGASLLLRGKKGVELTQAGKLLQIEIRGLIENWENIKSKSRKTIENVEGHIRLGCHPSVALYSLNKFLPTIVADYPLLEIQLLHDLSRKITENIINFQIDIGIVVNPIQHPDLVITKICDDEVVLWNAGKKNAAQDPYSGNGVLICDPDLRQTQEILGKLKKNSIKYKRIITSPNLEVIRSLIASGAGFGILPSRVAAGSSEKLHKINASPIFQDRICVVCRVENKNLKVVEVLKEAIIKGMK